MGDFPGLEYSFTQPISMRVSEMLTGTRGDVAIKVFGSDINKLNELAEKMVKIVEGIKGSEDAYTVKNNGVQYYRVVIDRLAAGRLGLSVDDISNTLRTQVEGRQLGTVIEEGRRTPLLVRGEADVQQSPALFSALTLPLTNGQSVPLSVVAKLERTDGPVNVNRENGKRMVVIQTNVRDRDLVGFVDEAKAAIAKADPTAGRLPHHLGRAVRKPATRGGSIGCRHTGRARLDLHAAVRHLPLGTPGRTGTHQHPFRTHGWRVRPLGQRRIYVRSGLGRFHRLARYRGIERRGHGVLLQSIARRRHGHHASHHGRCQATPAPGADDRQHHCIQSVTAVVRTWPRLGDTEAVSHRSHGWTDQLDYPDAVHAPDPVSSLRP